MLQGQQVGVDTLAISFNRKGICISHMLTSFTIVPLLARHICCVYLTNIENNLFGKDYKQARFSEIFLTLYDQSFQSFICMCMINGCLLASNEGK